MTARDGTIRIVEGMDEAEYHAVDATGGSGLGRASKSMADLNELVTPTERMNFGSATHCYLRGIGAFAAAYAVRPAGIGDGRSKAGKAFAEEAASAGKQVIDAADFEGVKRAVASIEAAPVERDILAGAKHEVSIFWTHDETGLPCKLRLDIWNQNAAIVADVKTTRDARPHSFATSMATFGYLLQAAHYLEPLPESLWVWICVENVAPYNVAIYQADPDDLVWARDKRAGLMARIAECKKTNVWPGYSAEPRILTLPRWAREDGENGNG